MFCCLSMPPNCALLMFVNASWLCFIVAHQFFLTTLCWCLLMLLSYPLLVLIGISQLCSVGVHQHFLVVLCLAHQCLIVVLQCLSTPPCCVLLVLVVTSLMCFVVVCQRLLISCTFFNPNVCQCCLVVFYCCLLVFPYCATLMFFGLLN